jgi:hypothetical protein
MRSRYVASLLGASALFVMTAGAAIAAPAQHAGTPATTSKGHSAHVASASVAAPLAGVGCGGSGSSRYCVVNVQDVKGVSEPYPVIFDRNTGIPTLVSGLISITCWYYGNAPSGFANDGVLDHAVIPVVGHIPDPYVNLGDENPWQSPWDLPECG